VVQAFGPMTFGFAVFSLAVSAAGVWVTIRVAHKVGVMDVPNERSSHSVPTPRMGGIAMVGAAVLSLTSWALLVAGEAFFIGLVWTVPLFALVMSGLGLWDDLSGLSPLFRFMVQVACSLALLLLLSMKIPLFHFEGYTASLWVWVPLGVAWNVWMLNLYNFMDGIDGLAGGEAAVAASFFFLVFAHFGESGWAAANLFVAAASMGFRNADGRSGAYDTGSRCRVGASIFQLYRGYDGDPDTTYLAP
jgi:UDP-N-acetylmuramyl pentapeptide phosphotransferase/UDP-N-acetylglucosamine-1-phosphate transferase